jgi:hypothetical protein
MQEQASANIKNQKHDKQVVEGSAAATKLASDPPAEKPAKTQEQIDKSKKAAADRLADQQTRIDNQRQKIAAGLAKGELTKDEAAKLQAEQDALQSTLNTYLKSGGKLSKTENQILEEMRDDAGDAIRAERKDKQKDQDQNFDHRIENGVKTGSLTEEEAKAIQQDRDLLEKVKSGEKLSDADREYIRNKGREISREIASEKHDQDTVAGGIQDVQKRIAARLKKGINKGDLTADEQAKLKGLIDEVETLKKQLAADGLTDDEVALINTKQDELLQALRDLRKNETKVAK